MIDTTHINTSLLVIQCFFRFFGAKTKKLEIYWYRGRTEACSYVSTLTSTDHLVQVLWEPIVCLSSRKQAFQVHFCILHAQQCVWCIVCVHWLLSSWRHELIKHLVASEKRSLGSQAEQFTSTWSQTWIELNNDTVPEDPVQFLQKRCSCCRTSCQGLWLWPLSG